MQAVRIHEFGGPEVLRLDRLDRPLPSEDELLVRVRAAGVNPVDWKTREGQFPPVGEDNLPITLGREICGEVTEKGPDVESFAAGEPVYANLDLSVGGYCDYALVKAECLAPKPRLLSDLQAAATPLAALTAWQGLFEHGGLTEGQRVLIHGGTGGVGHFAVQLAHHFGAWVATTVREDDAEMARSLGADRALDRSGDFGEEIEPVDLVLDLVGGETRRRSYPALREAGTLVSVLGEPEEEDRPDLHRHGFMTRPDAHQLSQIGALFDQADLGVTLDRCFDLEDAAEALSYQRDSHVRGKLALKVSDPIPEGT